MSERRLRYGWGAALAAGGLLRLLFFYHLRPMLGGDSLIYSELARDLRRLHLYGYSGTPVQPTLIRLPGYPLFLAAWDAVGGGAHAALALWVQMALDLFGCALLGFLAERLAVRLATRAGADGEERGAVAAQVGVAAVWLSALCPFTANYAVALMPESLSVFCVVTTFFALERWEACWRGGAEVRRGETWVWTVVIGCSLAWAVLLRPDQGLLAAAVLPAMLWAGWRARVREGWSLARGLLPATTVGLLILLPLLAWGVRNWRVFHVVQPLAPRYAEDPDETVPLGFYCWYRSWAIEYKSNLDIYWKYDDDPMRLSDLPARAFDDAQQRRETEAVFDRYNNLLTATPELDAAFAKIADERIAKHPVRYYVVLPVARELDMWLRPRLAFMAMPVDWWKFGGHPRESVEETAYALLNAGYLALAVVGLLRWGQRRWNGRGVVAFAMLGFVALRVILLLTLDNSEPRYTLECFPVVIVLAALALLPQFNG
ncbi:MAG: glycosyltransferase family 39 protein [Acidobacteriaceae bacterium]